MLTEVHYKIKVGFLKTGTCGKAPVITASIWPVPEKVTFGSTPFQNGCLYWLLVLAWELQQGFSEGWTLVPGIGMRLFAVGVWQACLHPSFISMDLTPAAFTLTWERLLDRFNSFRVTCSGPCQDITNFMYQDVLYRLLLHASGKFYESKDSVLLYLHCKAASRDVGIFWVRTIDQSLHLEFLGPFSHSVVGDIDTGRGQHLAQEH